MLYYVIESQTTKDGIGTTLITTKTDRNEAESDYHRVLSAAAVSNVYKHGAMLMTEDCMPVMYVAYEHGGEDDE